MAVVAPATTTAPMTTFVVSMWISDAPAWGASDVAPAAVGRACVAARA
jgi:hypothetical protein